MAFDVDPLDLDAEEPPEFQGEPRSPKSTSGSVTSPQANAHRLPFFKKVTPEDPRNAWPSNPPHPPLLHFSPSEMCRALILVVLLTEPLNLTPTPSSAHDHG